jgi:drug/metabolite transporter (DMT)-like permease
MAGRLFEMETFVFSMKGVILALCSSLTYAVYIVANGRVGKGVRWQSKSMMIMAGSSLCILSINTGEVMSFHNLDHEFVLWAIFLAVIGTTIPTALFAAGISKIGAGISSILMTVELPVAILCARVVLGERISAIQMAGVIIMLSSICAMNYYKSRKLYR